MRWSGRAETPAEESADRDDNWRPRPRRLLIGLGLIAIAIIWSVLNGTLGGYRGPAQPVIHGPVATGVQSLDGLRIRPEVPRGSELPGGSSAGAPPAQLTISFHNDAAVARPIAPRDLRVVVGDATLYPGDAGSQALHPAVVPPGRYVTAAVSFARPLAPGATLIFAPPWAHGRSLRWLLWR